MNKRKIAVVTGSRAEYGLLYWLMREIQEDLDLELQVIVTGMHLSPEFGLTYKLIEVDGFKIDYKVESQLSSDTGIGVAKSVGLGVIGFADAYQQLMPDMVVLLGDRFEILAAAQAALFAKIPIAHLYGGEVTEGAFDESIRHAITKMAHLHFVAAEPYRQRVIQLGENPACVFNVGVTGLDHLIKTQLLNRNLLEEQLNFKFGKLNFLITYHSATLVDQQPEKMMEELFSALENFQDAYVIFTKSNADIYGRVINQLIDKYVFDNPSRAISFVSLGSLRYLSLLKQIDIVIGNSSSGIVEAPYFKKSTVNIGLRQQGRLRTKSIIDCDENAESITHAIYKAIELLPVLQNLPVESSYGREGDYISRNIKEQIKKFKVYENGLMKKFVNMGRI